MHIMNLENFLTCMNLDGEDVILRPHTLRRGAQHVCTLNHKDFQMDSLFSLSAALSTT